MRTGIPPRIRVADWDASLKGGDPRDPILEMRHKYIGLHVSGIYQLSPCYRYYSRCVVSLLSEELAIIPNSDNSS